MTITMSAGEWQDFTNHTTMTWNRDIANAEELRRGVRRFISPNGDVVTVQGEPLAPEVQRLRYNVI